MTMKQNITAIAALSVLSFTMISPADASIQGDVNKCISEIKKTPEAADAKLKYKGSKGARVKSLKFEMKKEGEKSMVICKVKRGKIVEIVWP